MIGLPWLCVCAASFAAQSVRLPAALCAGSDSVFVDDFDASGLVPHDPSLGSGGPYPGNRHRTITVAGMGAQTYYLHIPAVYTPAQSMPLLILLHGTAGSHSGADAQATSLRNYWSAASDRYGFIVMAVVSNGSQRGWLAPDGTGNPNDYDVIAAELAHVEQIYNIERSRVSLWGFSAGAFVAWDMLLNAQNYVQPTPLNASNLAALATSSGNSNYACGSQYGLCNSLFAALPRVVPVIMYMGNADPRVTWAQADHQRLLANGWIDGQTLSYNEFVGGHEFVAAQLAPIGAFVCRYAKTL